MDFHTWMLETNAYRYLQEKFDDSLLVDVLSGASLKMELRKDTLPLFTFAHGYCGYVGSSWRIAGSGSLIAEALAEQIRSQGGEVICNAEVDELLEKEGQLTGVRCKDGRIYEGIQFICATHPAEMCRMLKQGGLAEECVSSPDMPAGKHQWDVYGVVVPETSCIALCELELLCISAS